MLESQRKEATVNASLAATCQREVVELKKSAASLQIENRRLKSAIEDGQIAQLKKEEQLRQEYQELKTKYAIIEDELKELKLRPTVSQVLSKVTTLQTENEMLQNQIQKKMKQAAKTKKELIARADQILELEGELVHLGQAGNRLKSNFLGLFENFERRLRGFRQMAMWNLGQMLTALLPLGDQCEQFRAKIEVLAGIGVASRRQYAVVRRQFKTQESLLTFAIQAMAKLAGTPLGSAPAAADVRNDPALLEAYFIRLFAVVQEKEVPPVEIKAPIVVRTTSVAPALSVMKELMVAMNEQMQQEHEELMTVLTDQRRSSSDSMTLF
jgi:myosin heavy subunit